MPTMLSGRRGMPQGPFLGAERQVWLRGREENQVSEVGWKAGSEMLTCGNETLGDAERLDDSRRIATFLLVFPSNLRSGHVDSILAFRELIDLVKNHVVDIKPSIEGVIRDDDTES